MSLLNSFKQPFPFNPSRRSKLVMASFFGLFVFTFLVFFKPFDLDIYPAQKLLIIALSYGIITFTCVFIGTVVFPICLPDTFVESKWTTGRQIIFTACIVFFVGLINYLVSPLIVDTNFELASFVWFQGITLAVALLPVSIFFLMRQNVLLKRFSHQAEIIEQKLQHRNEVSNANELSQPKIEIEAEPEKSSVNKLIFTGDYQNERIELFPDDLYVITSASNYIKLFHLQKEQLVYSMIRSTLKKAEEIALAESNFFKCHRAYIINLDKVVHVEGNAQGYKVRVEGYEELIPVSRNLNTEFSDKLLAFRKQ